MVIVFRGSILLLLADLGRSTGMAPTAIKVDVVSTIVSNTSITSTNGITLMPVNPFSSILNVPVHKDYFNLPKEKIVNCHGRNSNQQSYCGDFQGQGQTYHNFSGIH